MKFHSRTVRITRQRTAALPSVGLLCLGLLGTAALADDYSARFSESVHQAVQTLEPGLVGAPIETFEVRLVDPESGKKRRFESVNPWNAIMPDLFAFLETGEGDGERIYFVDLLERAIEAHMATLAELRDELEGSVAPSAAVVARFDPRDAGLIRVPPVGPFQDIAIHFRAMVEYDSGNSPGILVMFRYAADPDRQPLLCRLIIPEDGMRAIGDRTSGLVQAEVPRLVKTRSVLEAWVAGQWVRPPNDWQRYLIDEPLHPEATDRLEGRRPDLLVSLGGTDSSP